MEVFYDDEHFQLDTLQRETGDGSGEKVDDWMDGNSRIHPNHWSTAQTTFRVSDAPAHKRQKYDDLKDAHDGKGEQDRRTTIRQAKILKDTDTFCSICELPNQQAERVSSIIQESDISSNNYGGKSYEKIILSVMSLVVDESIDNPERMDQRLILQDEFKDLITSVGTSSSELRRIRQMIRERTDYFDGV